MNLWKIFFAFTLLTLLSGNKPSYALDIVQDSGTWEKLDTPRNFHTIEVTPWGIMAGEFSSSWGNNPNNGVFISHDLGATWTTSGLENRGVTDIAYDGNDSLYTTVYYWSTRDSPGVYKSPDHGVSWQKLGINYSSAAVTACGIKVVVGTYSHGLWYSPDAGVSWVQKKKADSRGGSGDYLHVDQADGVLIASNPYETYLSEDCGETWSDMSTLPSFVNDHAVHNNIRITCHSSVAGIYRSVDHGAIYTPVSSWGLKPCYSLTFYNGVFYASTYLSETGFHTVYSSSDWGLNWENIGPTGITSQLNGLTWLASDPGYIFVLSFSEGLYRYKVTPHTPKMERFLSKLWDRESMSEQTDTITSYFDHSYPLLAYPYKNEPVNESDTTTNFWGIRERIPILYYSSHEGVDFGLSYGTPILAPASGYASYSYTGGGGNTIKISHPNGYQTQYLHLQKKGLFTDKDVETWIERGEQVGLVGLTGNTTGPHLHFAVRYDKNSNGIFIDDIPDGRVDPYSWFSDTEDPWEVYSWQDASGDHNGTGSPYLWTDLLEVNSSFINRKGGSVLGDNITVNVPAEVVDKDVTLKVSKTTRVNTSAAEENLKYVENTSVNITAIDNLNKISETLSGPIEVTFNLSPEQISGIIPDTLKTYVYDKNTAVWDQVSSVFDVAGNTLTGFPDQLGETAVFGVKIDPFPPNTAISFTTVKDELWYGIYPVFELSAEDNNDGSGVEDIFYSEDGGDTWEEYSSQVTAAKEGVFAILYRSCDKAGNYEDAKDSDLLRVDTLNRLKDEVLLTGMTFTLSDEAVNL